MQGSVISDALADEIAARLGDLPLALDLVAEQLRLGMSWPIIKSRLEREHDLHYLGLSQGRVYAVIASSVAALPEEIVTRFHELAIFPPGESLDPKAVTHLWAATAGLDEAQSEQLLLALRSRALLKIDNIVHDLVRDYLQLQFVSTPGRLSELHVRLAQSYGSYLQWPLTSAEGMYPWRRVLWHLVLGDEIAHAQRMITDEHYLTSKISLFGSEAAAREADLSAKGNDQVQLLAAALRRSEHILDHDISQLQNQLFGRMGDRSPLHNASPHEISLQLVRPSLAQARDSELRVLDKHHARVNGCAFSPDGTLLASAGDDCAVRLWDVATGAERRVLQVKGDKRYGAAYACVYNPNGNLLAVASTRGIQIWHVSTGEFVSALTESDTSEWFHCAFSPDGTLVVGTGADGKLMLWDLQTNTLVKSFEGHQKNVWHCTFDTSGQMLASAGWDGTLRLWSVTTGEERQLMRNPDILGWLYCCAFSPDGESLVATGKNGKIQVWDIGTGHLRHQIVGHVSGVHDAVTECAFSPNGQVLATSSEDGTVRLWASSVVVRATGSRGHDGGITAGTFSPDGRLFATAGEDKTIRFWNVSSGIEDNSMRLHSRIGNLSSIAFSADGQLLAMVNTWDGLHLWNMTQQTDQSGRIRGYEGSDPGMCVFSPNGRLVAVANQGDVSLLEVAERPDVELRALVKRLHSTGLDWMPNLAAHPTFCAFSPDGRFLVGSGHQGGLCIWDVATRNLLEVADKRFFTVCGSFSPNGKLMVTSESRTLRLWSVANYEETARGFLGFKHRVMHMRISPRQELSTPYWIYSCSFSPDGRFVATSGSDSAVRVWDADSLTELVHITLEGEVRACAWHPKDLLIGAGDMSGRIHFMALNESTRIEAQG